MTVPVPASPAVAVRGLSKSFGAVVALHEVTFSVPWGSALTVFGPNGAGKSTLLRTIATLVRPDAGELEVAGMNSRRDAERIRRAIGYLGHQTLLYDELTAMDNLRFYARLYQIEDPSERIDEVLRNVGMREWATQRVRTMSNGMQKRIGIARALLHRPLVVLLDEPEAGLDQRSMGLLDSVVRGVVAGGATVILTTHSLDRGLALADHVVVLASGRVSLSGEASSVSTADIHAAMGPGNATRESK